jgi:hypothetical protein
MNRASGILAVSLLAALVAVPIAYQSGKKVSSREFEARYDGVMEEIRLEHARGLAEFDASLARVQMDWELKYARLQSSVREVLLNTGVTLEILNTEQEPEVVAETVEVYIPQDTYALLKIGMTYEEAAALLGREGTNRLNMMDAYGTGTSSYVWSWMNDEDIEVRLTVTFEDLKLTKKHYPAFKL